MLIKKMLLKLKRVHYISCFAFSIILLSNMVVIPFTTLVVYALLTDRPQAFANNSNLLRTDTNGDGVVNILDVSLVSQCFGSYPGHSRWNPNADINDDNTVDLLDISQVAKDFGKVVYPMFIQSYTADNDSLTAEDLAEHFDMCQATYYAGEKMQVVRQMRTDFKALLYRNMRTVYATADEWDLFRGNGWVLKDVNGNYVYSTEYPANRIVDIGNPGYQAWVANWMKENLGLYGFDGVFADMSLSATAGEWFWAVSATPINPRTGTYWTDHETRQAQIALHTKVKEAIGSKLLICNGIFHGTRFYERYEGFIEVLQSSPLDGFMSEGIWYRYNGYWSRENQWLDSLNFLIWTQDHFLKERDNGLVIPVCKLKSTSGDVYPLPSGCTKEQMLTYAFASTLLAVKTDQIYFGFIADRDFIIDFVYPLRSIDIGEPLNEYYTVEGTHVYARDFTGIKVLVNPTGQSYSVILDKDYMTLEGQVVSVVSVKSHSGLILRNPYNLLLNAFVEEDLDGDSMPDSWETWNYDDISVSLEWSAHWPHGGLRSLFASIQSNLSAPGWHSVGWRQFFNPPILEPSHVYKFRCWYRSNITIHLLASFWDSSHNWITGVEMQVPASDGEWKQTEWLNIRIPESAHHCAIGVALRNEDVTHSILGWTYFDDFELYETSST